MVSSGSLNATGNILMSDDPLVTSLARRSWLVDGPLSFIVPAYLDYLHVQRYADSTIHGVAN